MGFTIYYKSTRPITQQRADEIKAATGKLVAGRTWLSCEPVHFRLQEDGRLFGFSKPNFMPHPDAAAAANESLPDGTVRDMLDILCTLSRDFGVDWEFSHDHSDGPIGYIRGGVCEPEVQEQIEGFALLADGILHDLMGEQEERPSDDTDDDAEPRILPFRPPGR